MILGAVMVPHPPIIIPEIGMGEEHVVQKTIDSYHIAMKTLASWNPDTVIVISPHAQMYQDYFQISPGTSATGDFSRFHAGSVKFEVTYDTDLVDLICEYCQEKHFPAGSEYPGPAHLDHGVMVPLYFMNQYLKDYKLVRIGLSGLPVSKNVELGTYIQRAANVLHRRVAVIASGDLSHYCKMDGPYGFRPEGPQYDREIMEVMGQGDFSRLPDFDPSFRLQAGECGHGSFATMSGILDGYSFDTQCLSHEDTFGVGYGVCIYSCQDPYVQLAKNAIETYVKDQSRYEPTKVPYEMRTLGAGVFVSLHKNDQLRGCIGTFIPTRDNVVEEILSNAVHACSRDPRFYPVQKEELKDLEVSVDILGQLERVYDPSHLDVKKYGILVADTYGRKGLLLPNLEGVHTVQQQISIAMQKAGIDETEEISIERFQVERHI